MLIRQLTVKDKEELMNLIDIIEDKLVDKTWWLPIDDKSRSNFFNEDWCTFYGVFENNKLIAASALFLDDYEFGEVADHIKSTYNGKFGEIGRCMVLPEYRGNNYVYKINLELVKIAKKLKLDYIIATAHPENLASNKSLEKLGMNKVAYIVKEEIYPRNILLAIVDEI